MLGIKPLDPGTCIGSITGKDACVIGMLGIVNGCCRPVITGGVTYNCSACGAVLPAARDGIRFIVLVNYRELITVLSYVNTALTIQYPHHIIIQVTKLLKQVVVSHKLSVHHLVEIAS